MEFTKLETAALAMLVDEYGSEYPGLAEHLAALHPVARENTGGGFFTDLSLDTSAGPMHHIDMLIDGVGVRPEGMRTNLEIILFFRDGCAYLLEGHAIEGEDTSKVDFEAGRFEHMALLWPSRKTKP